MLRRFYDWVMKLAEGPRALPALAIISFVESSFFPIPPDVLLVPMILAARHRAFVFAFVCTLASVVGGYVGYAIGYYAFEALARPILEFYHAMPRYEEFKVFFDKYGAIGIIGKGLTPFPYKIVTIASGAFHFDLTTFGISSFISRSLRFFLEAILLWHYGDPIRDFIERRLALVTTAFLIILVGGFILISYI